MFAGVLVTAAMTALANHYLMPVPVLNFMLSGMVYSATFANILDEKKLEDIMKYCTPSISACFALIVLNLGAPLDYHLILGAGIFTAVYIIARAAGKIGGAALGAQLSHAPATVKKISRAGHFASFRRISCHDRYCYFGINGRFRTIWKHC